MNLDRDSLLAALRRAKDPRGLRPHQVTTLLQLDGKSRHRVPRMLSLLVDEGAVERTEGARYRPVGWAPVLPPPERNDIFGHIARIIDEADIPDEFPDAVEAEAAQVPTTVTAADCVDRLDLRDHSFLTIDPETARDFDDAVCVEDGPSPGLERLWVAVADVSHYVRPRSEIDREARQRGVSVYLPDRAISMLPTPLSAGICSLNPAVDRLAMVVRMDIAGDGQVVDAQCAAAVIRSRARFDYAGVATALQSDGEVGDERYREHLPQLLRLRALAGRLRQLRIARGSLDFDLPEAVVVLDKDHPGQVLDVKRARAKEEVRQAYRLIEDCMLAANEAVARFFAERNLDTLWRAHAPPTDIRLEEFATLATSLGVKCKPDELRTPRQVGDFLARIAENPMERSLSYLLLRSLKQATYDVENVGHFGLAAPEYLHFTSPIRRYPDLIVHRLLKQQLRREGQPAGGGDPSTDLAIDDLRRAASTFSSFERRGMEVEREVVSLYRAWLMRERIGAEFDGVIVGVTSFGLFVEIAEPFIEGMIRTETLGREQYHLDDRTMRLTGERSSRSFALGDAVRVRIAAVSIQRRRIELSLVAKAEKPARKKVSGTTRKRY